MGGHAAILNDADRLADLAATKLVGGLPEDSFDRAVRLATRITGAPVSLVSLVTGELQFFKAHTGLGEPIATEQQTPLSHSFCQYVVTSDDVLGVSDARQHPLLKENSAVTDLGVVAYLGVPIHAPSGRALGAFCAIDTLPRNWDEEDAAALRDIARGVETEIALRQTVDDKQVLLGELDHRVKNTFAIISSLVGLSARQASSIGELSSSLRSRIDALARAHGMIVPTVGATDNPSDGVGLQELIRTLIEPHIGKDLARVSIEGPPINLGPQGCQAMTLAIHELATNATKYGAFSTADGKLAVKWEVQNDILLMTWSEENTRALDQPPNNDGFGTKLISVSATKMNGRFSRHFKPTGIECNLVASMPELLR